MQIKVANDVTLGVVIVDSATGSPVSSFVEPSEAHTSALAASLVVKASAGTLLSVMGYNNSSAVQYVQIHNAASVPADSAVPIIAFAVQPTDNFVYSVDDLGQAFSIGIVVCNSLTLTTKTLGSANCWFNVRYR